MHASISRTFLHVCLTTAFLFPFEPLLGAEFSVTSATLAGAAGLFSLESRIAAGESAVVTVKVTTEDDDQRAIDVRRVIESLRTSVPAEIATADDTPSDGITTITMTVNSAAAVTAKLSYLKEISDVSRIGYDLDVTTKKLNGFATIRDESGSNARWRNATVYIRHTLGYIESSGINMATESTTTVPIRHITGFTVGVKPQTFVRTGAVDFGTDVTKVYEVWTLTNPRVPNIDLPEGTFRVFTRGRFMFERRIPNGLAPGASVDLQGNVVKEVAVAEPTETTTWHFQAESLNVNTLTIQQWKGQQFNLTNNQDKDVTVRLGGTSTADWKVEAKTSRQTFAESMKAGEPKVVDLLDIADQSALADKLEILEQIRRYDRPADEAALVDVVRIYEQIAEARKNVLALEAGKTALEAMLTELTLEVAPAAVLDQLRDQIRQTETALDFQRMVESRAVLTLTTTLF